MVPRIINRFLLKTMGWIPARVVLAILAWFGFINLYMTRINVSVIIVAMVKGNSSTSALAPCLLTENNTMASESIPPDNSTSTHLSNTDTDHLIDEDDIMEWDEALQGIILGSFFYGYAMTMIPGGRLAEVYGSKWLFGFSIFGGGICAILSPFCAKIHYGLFIALRVLHGAIQGASWPAMHACIARWIPPLERPRFIGTVYFGNTLSTAITLPLCSAIIDAYGWPAAFYITGGLSVIWFIFWSCFMHNTPDEHPRISDKEYAYIMDAVTNSGTTVNKASTSSKVPWKKIFTSMPMISIILADTGNKWGMTLFYAQLPTYMSNILGFSIKSNGAISALPFATRYVGCITLSSLADWLLTRKYCSIRTVRRIFGTIALWCPALMMLGVTYVGCNWKIIVAMFCIGLFFNGAITASVTVNHTDIAPNYAGTLFGISNSLSTLVIFFVPVVTGVLTKGQQTVGQWQIIFGICVPIYIVAHLIFFIFCSGSVQPWNYEEEKENHEREKSDEEVDVEDVDKK